MPTTGPKPIRVVLADDSALMRKLLRQIFDRDPELEVVACARDGQDAVAAVKAHDPDVVTLDVNMPGMDGVAALQAIMDECPRPVVMISSLTQEGALATYECLELGAVDCVAKPSGTISRDITDQSAEIAARVKAAARARPRRGRRAARPAPPTAAPRLRVPGRTNDRPGDQLADRLVAIGVSTGGPKTLMEVVPALPADLPAAVVIVQHMPESFTASLARSLDAVSRLPVTEAEAGEPLHAGRVYVARGGKHLTFVRRRIGGGVMFRYSTLPAGHLHVPSADVMMESAAEAFGPRAVGVLLTGMGSDGAAGMVAIRRAGGPTIAEAESTCVVFGMPAAAIARGGAEHVLPCGAVPAKVAELLRGLR